MSNAELIARLDKYIASMGAIEPRRLVDGLLVESRDALAAKDKIVAALREALASCLACEMEHANLASEQEVEPVGTDPTTELFKPRGNNGIVSADICFDALLLTGEYDVAEGTVGRWSQEQLDRAYDWAIRRYLEAADIDDVIVPPRPEFIPKERSDG
jgi:hypothetical protein